MEVLPVIRMRIRFARPVDDLWESFFDPILMLQWLGNEIQAEIHEGGTIRFDGDNAPTTAEIGNTWEIEQIKKGSAILFSWRILGASSLVLLRFRQVGTFSYIELKHGAIPSSAKDFHLSEHWNLLFANFKSVLELGAPAYRFEYSEYHPLTLTRYDPVEVRHSVHIEAPAQLPFDVWTNPEKLKHFIRAYRPRVDQQYGGIYTWWAEGKGPVVFTKMQQDREIEFTWVHLNEPETKVNIRFEELDDSTLVTLHHHGFRDPEAVIGYDIGWASILSELKLVCELGASGIEREIDWAVEEDPDFIREYDIG
ncbi:MAG: hypothetical protein GF411_00645 [Candidatus Lokiarchaeota archaeon]|nr:hypothetical protein [Candidatus Lokiarchaeota archaeon]